MGNEKIVISALEIYEAVYDSARSEWVPDDFAGQVADIKDYADGVWNITLSDEYATKIARCRKSLLEANEKDGQWSFNYDNCVVFPLQDVEYKGDDPTNSWGGAREGAGRPAEAGEIRKNRNFKATDDEWGKIKAKDKVAGMSASEYIRMKTME